MKGAFFYSLLAVLGRCLLLTPFLAQDATGVEVVTDPTTPELEAELVWDLDDRTFSDVWWNYPSNDIVQLKFAPVGAPGYSGRHVIAVMHNGVLAVMDSIDDRFDQGRALFEFSAEVYQLYDRGVQSFAFDPDWPAQPYGYIFYSGKITGTPPWWDLATPDEQQFWNQGGCPGGAIGLYTDSGRKCKHYGQFRRINLDYDAATNRITSTGWDQTLIGDGTLCSMSTTHAPGSIVPLSDGSFMLTVGDGADYDSNDAGQSPNDECPNELPGSTYPNPQGAFRAQQDEILLGKMFRITPANYRGDAVLGTIGELGSGADFEIIGKGVRNPFRAVSAPDGSIYFGDVASDWAEEVNHLPNPLATGTTPNFGWPCLEGGSMGLSNAIISATRQAYLEDNEYTLCDPVYGGGFVQPKFQYRIGAVDPDYPLRCGGNGASITSVLWHESGGALPSKYGDKLLFGDYTKGCMFYFDSLGNGEPDYSQARFMAELRAVDMQVEPTSGELIVSEVRPTRIYRLREGDGTAAPSTAPPTATPTAFEVSSCVGITAATDCGADTVCQKCKDAIDMSAQPPPNSGDVGWTFSAGGQFGGEYSATMTMEEVSFYDDATDTLITTRAFDGLIPGPTIRMEACQTYRLTLVNNLSGTNPTGPLNTFHDPLTINLHTHGIHISGVSPADDPSIRIDPGESFEYIYRIPCDHSGGTFWYHTHHHGSVALQTGAGAAGALIIEDNPLVEGQSKPTEYLDLDANDEMIVMQEFIPESTNRVATLSSDDLWYSNTLDTFYMVNGNLVKTTTGAAPISETLGVNERKRLRFLFIGHEESAHISIPSSSRCNVELLAKDGIYLSDLPRVLEPDEEGETHLFFTMSSRVDIAISCRRGTYRILLEPGELGSGQRIPIMDLSVDGPGALGAPLPEWMPCRSRYLQDVYTQPATNFFDFDVRADINGELFSDFNTYLAGATFVRGRRYTISVGGTEAHPFHMHVNHFQVQAMTTDSIKVPNWHQPGDWIDNVAAVGVAVTVMEFDRYTGPVVAHCHVLEHSDEGVIVVTNVVGAGQGPLDDPSYDFSDVVCPGDAPICTPEFENFVSDRPELIVRSENGQGPIEFDQSNGGVATGDGDEISIAGQLYTKGLGTQAPLDLDLNVADYRGGSFIATVGVDDSYAGQAASVQCEVCVNGLCNGNYESPILGATGDFSSPNRVWEVEVPIGQSTTELRLVCDGLDSPVYDRVNWGGARLLSACDTEGATLQPAGCIISGGTCGGPNFFSGLTCCDDEPCLPTGDDSSACGGPITPAPVGGTVPPIATPTATPTAPPTAVPTGPPVAGTPVPSLPPVSPTPAPVTPGGGDELLVNPTFADGLAGWETYLDSPATSSIVGTGGRAEFVIGEAGTDWHVQLFQVFPLAAAGEEYTLLLDVVSLAGAGPREVQLFLQQSAAPWILFGSVPCSVTATVTQCSLTAVVGSVEQPVKFGIFAGQEAVDFAVEDASLRRVDGGGGPNPAPTPVPTTAATSPPATSGENLLVNGDFAASLSDWTGYVSSTNVPTATITAAGGGALISMDAAGTANWHVQLFQVLTLPTAGQSYTLSADVTGISPGTRNVELYFQQVDADWLIFGLGDCAATEGVTVTCSVTGVVTDVTIAVKVGVQGGDEAGDFSVDNVVFALA